MLSYFLCFILNNQDRNLMRHKITLSRIVSYYEKFKRDNLFYGNMIS